LCSDYADSSLVKAQCNSINKGDLCYSKLRPYLDKAFIASFDAVSTTELLVYKTKDVSKEYVLHHFHSKHFINYASGKGYGTKMPRVSHKIIGEYQIKLIPNESALLEEMSSPTASFTRFSKIFCVVLLSTLNRRNSFSTTSSIAQSNSASLACCSLGGSLNS
jgi:type I restriction enzyme S subunit